MKSIKKLWALLIAVLIVAASAFTALAATQNTEVLAGETAIIEFTYDPAYNLSGVISWSADEGVIESITVEYAEDLSENVFNASLIGENGIWVVPKEDADTVGGKITVCVKVVTAEDAAEGSTIKVSFNGEYGNANKGQGDDTPVDETAVIVVNKLDPPPTGDNGAIVFWGTAMVLAACVVISRRRMFN